MSESLPRMSPSTAPAATEPALGDRLRMLRQRNKWSLATVSEKTGLATSTLSRIENNQLSLTYEKLLQLSRGLGLDLAELISGTDPAAPARTGRRAYTPPGGGREIQTQHHYYRYLCTEITGKKMTPIIGKVTATDISEVGGFLRHEGEEIVFVISGTLEVHTEFYEPLRVETGGCVYFDSNMGHAFVAVGGPATFLSVCSCPEPALGEIVDRRGEAQMQSQPAAAARRETQSAPRATPKTQTKSSTRRRKSNGA
jgi:transcriptional regulator with XRE-family HTH domain